MADLQKKADGKGIAYPGTVASSGDAVRDSQTPGTSLYLFLNGGVGSDGKTYPKVDMSLWDQATMCGTCHVGGTTYEHDRNGQRLPYKTLLDMFMGVVNPFTSTVWESFTAGGADTSFATVAPWVYPQYKQNNPAMGPVMANPANAWVTTDPYRNPVATGEVAMYMKDPNTGGNMPVYSGQLMMPNVKEMDCLFCHLSGYDNVMSSVMVQAGSLNAAPGAGAGLFDIAPNSPTYMGYDAQRGNAAFTPYSTAETGKVEMVSLSSGLVSRIKGQPESNNCMQCHATKTLKNLPEMFGITGGSNGFLSSAPMVYDPNNGVGPLGKRMTSYDINAMWLFSGSSPVITMQNMGNYMMAPGMGYLQAMDTFRTPDTPLYMGGGKPAGSGPLYYLNADGSMPNQDTLKRSTMPFPRAEWFKRGDAWQEGKDVHTSFGCAGCHFTGDTTHKNQCDPGRGFDMASTTQDGVPPLAERQVVKGYDADGKAILASGGEIGAAIQKADTRNTVKRCEFCHLTGKDYYGNPISTFGAPNPTPLHAKYGLTNNIVQIVDKLDPSGAGTFGRQGVSDQTNFTSEKTRLGRGNHLDVMDCTVCHVQKETMAVRALDATSGMRFPAIVGTDPAKGMVGLFEDPAPDTFNAAIVGMYNDMYNTIYGTTGQTYVPAGTHVMGGPLKEWKPLHLWQKLGNMEAPLSFANGGSSQLQYRRKIYLSNAISAVLWNNTDSHVDANGDTVPGGLLIGDNDELGRAAKPSLVGYTDVFDNVAPNKNNTQGYGEPIYDPWIMHDLKAGFNFGPSALSVISVGFDDMMTKPSGSAYMPDGTFSSAEYWKYASVWSGAVVFTEPKQISEYKAFRTKMACGDENATGEQCDKSWKGTELAYVGAPFMVTHGVQATDKYVKGKSCTDCHAQGAGFFNGGFNMTGSAIPADREFNPTSQLQYNEATGDYVRQPGMPGLSKASNLMERPLEPTRVKAVKGDLRTFFEGFNKLGQPRSSKFEKDLDLTENGKTTTYTVTTDLKRSDVLYPEEDGAIYYKITDTNLDGSPKAGARALTGQEYADYLESIQDAASLGIGTDPVAVIDTIDGKLATGATSIPLTKGKSYALNVANPTSYTTYSWDTNAGVAIAGGPGTSVTFPKAGTWRITLTATNPDGRTVTRLQKVNVIEPVLVSVGTISSDNVTVTVHPTVGNDYTETRLMTTVPVTIEPGTVFDKVKVNWGDGSRATNIVTDTIAELPAHQYLRLAKYKTADGTGYRYTTTVQLFKGTSLVTSKAFKVFVAN